MVRVVKAMATSFKRSHVHTATLSAPTLQQAAANPRVYQRLLVTPEQAWPSLLWGHCCFLLDSDEHKVLIVPSKSLFPQSCKFCN